MSSPADSGLMADGGDVERLVTGQHHDPHDLLGPHPERDSDGRDRVVIRGWRPDTAGMVILVGEQRIEMGRVHPAGLFAAALEGPGSRITAWRRLIPMVPWWRPMIRTGSGPRSGRSTCTCWRKAGMKGCGVI